MSPRRVLSPVLVPPARLLLAALVVAGAPLFTACGGDSTVTKDDFVKHAMDMSKAATTPEQKAALQKIYECVWPKISKQADVLKNFMDSSAPTPEVNKEVSKLMGSCYMAAVPSTSTPTTPTTADAMSTTADTMSTTSAPGA